MCYFVARRERSGMKKVTRHEVNFAMYSTAKSLAWQISRFPRRPGPAQPVCKTESNREPPKSDGHRLGRNPKTIRLPL